MLKKSFLILVSFIFFTQVFAQQTVIKYLSGTDKDHTVSWDFFCTSGMKSGSWSKIAVPSNWELQGFGAYNYGQDKVKHDEQGLYKTHFKADASWKEKEIQLVFDGVMTDADVKINGKSAGAIHQGSFYRFIYNITPLIKWGEDNLLEVTVSKVSADPSVNHAEREGDFWIFGGIYRPVFLKIQPKTFVNRVAIAAPASGQLSMDVFAENLQAGDEISAQVKSLRGVNFGPVFTSVVKDPASKLTLSQNFNQPALWNPEYPNLYTVSVSIRRKAAVLHIFTQRFGFRTVEVRKGDGIYVNNVKVRMKGVDRHSAWPETGRTLSRKVHLMDIGLIKDMNMNAVRMSHYPPDAEFLDLCDSLGLFVLDELTGWHQKYATPVGEKLVKEMVVRDVNHPSIIFWDNGNEGGWNTDLDDDYALYDPQLRTVLHPWNNFNNVDTKHYPDYSYVEAGAQKNDIMMHTEMIHGLYDGGHGAGLDDYWNLMLQNPRHAGGFLWVLADEAVVRTDKKDSLDTDGNHAPDGIVGPHREKEGSYYTIKEIWSPVIVKKPVFPAARKADLEIENGYLYTNLSACSFTWKLVKFPLVKSVGTSNSTLSSGKASLALAPGAKAVLHLDFLSGWKSADALVFTATDKTGHEIYTWTWPLKSAKEIASQNFGVPSPTSGTVLNGPEEKITGEKYVITFKGVTYTFSMTTGQLESVMKNGQTFALSHGPVLAGVNQTLARFSHVKSGTGVTVKAEYGGKDSLAVSWDFMPAQQAVRLNYSYSESASANFYGITFNLDESKTKGIKWMGDGPYRVWKNRLKGVSAGVWQKKYNNTITGEGQTLEYPEFKGYFSNFKWATLQADPLPFTVYTETDGIFLQLFQPLKQKVAPIAYVNPPFPEGTLGFLTAIAPIGTKFKGAETMGPQSQKNEAVKGMVSGTLWFDFK